MLVNSFLHYFQFIHKTYGMLRVTWILDGNEENRYVVTNVIFLLNEIPFPLPKSRGKDAGVLQTIQGQPG